MGRVYLAGPITGLTYRGADDWRRAASAELRNEGITSLSPLRSKEYLASEGILEDQYHNLNVLSSAVGITTRDRWDATRADVVLANFIDATRVSIGTVLECAWADSQRTPLVVACEPGNVHDHAMLRTIAGFWVPTLEEALTVTKAILKEV